MIKKLRSQISAGLHRIAQIKVFNKKRRRRVKDIRRRQEAEHGATVMFDSVTVSEIPSSAPAVAGYVDGAFETWPELVTGFPKAGRLPIAVFASGDAVCLDVESGDARPDEAVAWVKRQKARGVRRPVVYTSASGVDSLLELLKAGGIDREDVRVWSAHYTFQAHLCGPHSCGEVRSTTVDATQWTDKALGRNLDESLLSATFWEH